MPPVKPTTTQSSAGLASTPRSGARPLFSGQSAAAAPSSSRGRPAAGGAPRTGSRGRSAARPAAAPSQASGGRTSGRTSGGTKTSQRSSPRRSGPSRTGTQGRARRQRRQPNAANRAASYARAGRQVTSPNLTNYQGIILAEFIAAELLVALSPIATRQNMPGLSPYIPRDMSKMLAIGLLYFGLQLGAVGGSKFGRVGAWLGGLVLLTVGLNEAANLSRDLDIFGIQERKARKQPHVTDV